MSKHAYFQLQPIPEIMQAIDKFIGTSQALHSLQGDTRLTAIFFAVSYLLVERRRRDSRIKVKLQPSSS